MRSPTDTLIGTHLRVRQPWTDDLFVAGLAGIAAANSSDEVNRLGAEIIRRLPGIDSVSILSVEPRMMVMDENYDLTQSALLLLAERSLRGNAAEVWSVPGHPDALVAPLTDNVRITGGIVVRTYGRQTVTAQFRSIAVVTIAIQQAHERIRLQQDLNRSIIPEQLERAVEGERKAISRLLHDGPAQDLAAIGLMLDGLIGSLGDHVDEAQRTRQVVTETVTRIRTTISDLRTRSSASKSVTGPLRAAVADAITPELSVDLDVSSISGTRLDAEAERALVGIVREAVRNVVKHAQARAVRVEGRRISNGIEISVIDDGIGIQRPATTGHFGLVQIHELAEETGGRVQIGAAPGGGTSVRAWVPLSGAMIREPRPIAFAVD